MAENEKDVPVKELEDGSVVAKVDFPEEIELEDKKPEVELSEEDEEEARLSADDNVAAEDGETEEEREAIREARREERKLKKELSK